MGRNLIIGIGTASLLVSGVVILLFLSSTGGKLHLALPRLVRFALTIALFAAMYFGQTWARLLTGVLYLGGGLGSLVFMQSSGAHGTGLLLLTLLGLFYATSGALLLFLPHISEYMVYMKPRATPEHAEDNEGSQPPP